MIESKADVAQQGIVKLAATTIAIMRDGDISHPEQLLDTPASDQLHIAEKKSLPISIA